MASKIDKFGTPEAYNHYAVGWAHAMDTPYQWTKQVASHWGGTRNGTIVRWPTGIKAKGELRHQFHHVIDVAPTVLEAAGLPAPLFVNGIQQAPLEGVSMAYSFDDAAADDRHTTQYFEMFVNRGIYHKGWTAVTRHSTPWVMAPAASHRRRRLGAVRPRRLDTGTEPRRGAAGEAGPSPATVPHRGRQVPRAAARRSSRRAVQPGPRGAAAAHPRQPPAPVRGHGPADRELGRGDEEQVVRRSPPRSRCPEGGAHGAIVAQGGAFGGLTLYLDGRPAGLLLQPVRAAAVQGRRGDDGSRRATTRSGSSSPTTAAGSARVARSALYLDGSQGGEGRVDATVPMVFSGDETTDVGSDTGTPVTDDLVEGRTSFTGRVEWVQIDIGRGRRGRGPPDQRGGALPGGDGAPVSGV